MLARNGHGDADGSRISLTTKFADVVRVPGPPIGARSVKTRAALGAGGAIV